MNKKLYLIAMVTSVGILTSGVVLAQSLIEYALMASLAAVAAAEISCSTTPGCKVPVKAKFVGTAPAAVTVTVTDKFLTTSFTSTQVSLPVGGWQNVGTGFLGIGTTPTPTVSLNIIAPYNVVGGAGSQSCGPYTAPTSGGPYKAVCVPVTVSSSLLNYVYSCGTPTWTTGSCP